MATITKRGRYWCVRYWVTDELGNRVGQKRVSGYLTKEDAMAAAKDLEQKTAAGIDVHGGNSTCGEIMEQWFNAKMGTIEHTTLVKYSFEMDQLQNHAIYRTPVKNLNRQSPTVVINDIVRERGCQISTAKDYLNPLKMSLAWAFEEGIIPRNPIQGARMPRSERREQHILDKDGIEDLIRVCRQRRSAFITPLLLAIYGGMCREECAGLEWKHVNLETGAVTVQAARTTDQKGTAIQKGTKNQYRKRTISMPSFVLDHLKQLPKRSSFVCCSHSGEPYHPHSFGMTMSRLVAAVNRERTREGKEPIPPVSFHDLRHSHAAMLIEMGIQPKVISERLGHSSIKITMDLYGYLMPGLQEQVASALDNAWSKVGTKVDTKVDTKKNDAS